MAGTAVALNPTAMLERKKQNDGQTMATQKVVHERLDVRAIF